VSAYREKVLALLGDWQGALEASPPIARQILRKMLVSDIVVTPRQDAYGGRWFEFKADGTFQRIVYGVIGFGEVGVRSGHYAGGSRRAGRPDRCRACGACQGAGAER
jgi:hypothetical protein